MYYANCVKSTHSSHFRSQFETQLSTHSLVPGSFRYTLAPAGDPAPGSLDCPGSGLVRPPFGLDVVSAGPEIFLLFGIRNIVYTKITGNYNVPVVYPCVAVSTPRRV